MESLFFFSGDAATDCHHFERHFSRALSQSNRAIATRLDAIPLHRAFISFSGGRPRVASHWYYITRVGGGGGGHVSVCLWTGRRLFFIEFPTTATVTSRVRTLKNIGTYSSIRAKRRKK